MSPRNPCVYVVKWETPYDKLMEKEVWAWFGSGWARAVPMRWMRCCLHCSPHQTWCGQSLAVRLSAHWAGRADCSGSRVVGNCLASWVEHGRGKTGGLGMRGLWRGRRECVRRVEVFVSHVQNMNRLLKKSINNSVENVIFLPFTNKTSSSDSLGWDVTPGITGRMLWSCTQSIPFLCLHERAAKLIPWRMTSRQRAALRVILVCPLSVFLSAKHVTWDPLFVLHPDHSEAAGLIGQENCLEKVQMKHQLGGLWG